MNYMGIDHHKQYSHITMLNEKGKKLKSGRVANYRSELERFLDGSGEVKAVIEAGRSSYTMVDLLDELSIDVTIAHAKQVKAIAKAKIKTDKRDYFMLAHLLRTDLIPEVYKRSRENRGYTFHPQLMGGRTYHDKIVKQGNRWLRWAAVEVVWPSLKADFDMNG